MASRGVLNADEKLISQCAKKFGVMNEFFVLPAALTVKKPLTTSVDAGRYNSDTTALEGVIAEIYENIPESLHDDLANSIAFRDLVSKSLQCLLLLPLFCSSVSQAAEFSSKEHRLPIPSEYRSGTIWTSSSVLPG
jgi:hypothetical protein